MRSLIDLLSYRGILKATGLLLAFLAITLALVFLSNINGLDPKQGLLWNLKNAKIGIYREKISLRPSGAFVRYQPLLESPYLYTRGRYTIRTSDSCLHKANSNDTTCAFTEYQLSIGSFLTACILLAIVGLGLIISGSRLGRAKSAI